MISIKFVKIPKDRVGVLIGHEGATKKQIQEVSGIELDVDSQEGEVVFNEQEAKDPLMGLKIENIIRAIGRGFSPEHALVLFDDDMDFFLFDIYDYVGKKPSQVRRLKSRIIGRNGKTKRVIEELSGAYVSIYGHTVSVINNVETMDITKRAVDMLLAGSKHHTVYRFLEREMKKLKMMDYL